jgi:hypothetical protein
MKRQSARAEEAAEKKKELEDKNILPKIDEGLEEDKPVTEPFRQWVNGRNI